HRSNYKSYLNSNCDYNTVFRILKYDDYSIELIENYPCNNETELLIREAYWIKQLDCVNKIIPTRTKSEYHNDNKEKRNKVSKEYYENNKAYIKQYKQDYYQNNKEEIDKQNKK